MEGSRTEGDCRPSRSDSSFSRTRPGRLRERHRSCSSRKSALERSGTFTSIRCGLPSATVCPQASPRPHSAGRATRASAEAVPFQSAIPGVRISADPRKPIEGSNGAPGYLSSYHHKRRPESTSRSSSPCGRSFRCDGNPKHQTSCRIPPHFCLRVLPATAGRAFCNARSDKSRHSSRSGSHVAAGLLDNVAHIEPAFQVASANFALGVFLVAGPLQELLVLHFVIR